MRTTIRIAVDQVTNKPAKLCVKFDDERAGRMTIDISADLYATHNNVVPIVPVLAKMKIRPAKPSSPEIQRILQFPHVSMGMYCLLCSLMHNSHIE